MFFSTGLINVEFPDNEPIRSINIQHFLRKVINNVGICGKKWDFDRIFDR